MKQLRYLFPPLVSGTIVFTIGLSLYPTAIPSCVLGGATITVFVSITMTGIKLITQESLTAILLNLIIPKEKPNTLSINLKQEIITNCVPSSEAE